MGLSAQTWLLLGLVVVLLVELGMKVFGECLKRNRMCIER